MRQAAYCRSEVSHPFWTIRRRSAPRRTARVVAAIALVLLPSACGASREAEAAGLVIGDTVAADFAALAVDTFTRFAEAAPALEACLGSPRLEAASQLDDAALYDQASRTIYVRVPATAPSLRASLTHELAHHVELACPTHEKLRTAFLAAQGHDPATPWFDAGRWEGVPSEEFAEAVVEVIEGRRSRNQGTVVLAPEAVAVVARWMATGE